MYLKNSSAALDACSLENKLLPARIYSEDQNDDSWLYTGVKVRQLLIKTNACNFFGLDTT